MAGLKTRVDKLDERVTRVENQVSELTANVNALVRELKDFKDEMRQQNQMRADEIREIRQDMKDMQKSFYSKMDNMDSKIETHGQIRPQLVMDFHGGYRRDGRHCHHLPAQTLRARPQHGNHFYGGCRRHGCCRRFGHHSYIFHF